MARHAKPGICLVLVLFILSVFARSLSADGGVVVYDPDMLGWELHGMNQQFSAINYENGFENMLLYVDIDDLHGEKAVWIFPVPAKPEETEVDVIKGFPRFHGYDVKSRAYMSIDETFSMMRLSQIYWLPFEIALFGHMGGRTALQEGEEGVGKGVTIHEHIEKMGLTTELVTAEDKNAFYNYLASKDLDLPPDLKSALEYYDGKEYSFVVSWISNPEEFEHESATGEDYETLEGIGVFIRFPTDKIYFPLKLTSVYGSRRIPILIYVIGYVSPELYPEIEHRTQTTYFYQGYYTVPDDLSSFFNGKTTVRDLRYTKIKIDVSSKHLRDDLWIKDSAPTQIVLADFINRYTWLWGITLFILSSCSASMFAGMIAFMSDQPSKKRFALFGLWNFLTLIGFTIAALFLKTEKIDRKLKHRLKSQGIVVLDRRKVLFVILFTVFFLIITIVLQIILQHSIL